MCRDSKPTCELPPSLFTHSRSLAVMRTSTAFRDRLVEQLHKDFPALSGLPFGYEKWAIEDSFIATQYFVRKMNEQDLAKMQVLALLAELPFFAPDDFTDLSTLALYSALPYFFLHDNLKFEIDWPAFEAYELFAALPDCFPIVPIGSQWKMIPPEHSDDHEPDDFVEAQWIRVPAPPIAADVLMRPRFKRPVIAADIPCDLHDLIAHYFIDRPCFIEEKNRGHECRGGQECERNYIRCSQEELRNMALVCRRWTRTVQAAIFVFPQLHNRRVIQLETLLKNPTTPIRQYIVHIDGDFDGAEHLRNPSVHHLGLSVIPKLSGLKNSSCDLKLEGPLPKKHQMLSSIHAPFPKVLPRFSAGIRHLSLKSIHFKTFTHLVQLIREMPSVDYVDCKGVTWGTREGEIIYPTLFLARDNPSEEVEYSMHGCTDDASGAWLAILLGQTRADVLDRLDADLLCAIAKAGTYTSSVRKQDFIVFLYELTLNVWKSNYLMYAYLTPRAPKGVTDRRRISAIVFNILQIHKDIDWRKIDEALATSLDALGTLQVVLFILDDDKEREEYLNDIALSMPFLTRSLKLKFALWSKDVEGNGLYTQAVLEDGEFREIGNQKKFHVHGKRFYRETDPALFAFLPPTSSSTAHVFISLQEEDAIYSNPSPSALHGNTVPDIIFQYRHIQTAIVFSFLQSSPRGYYDPTSLCHQQSTQRLAERTARPSAYVHAAFVALPLPRQYPARTEYAATGRPLLTYRVPKSDDEASTWAKRTVNIDTCTDNLDDLRVEIGKRPIPSQDGDQTFLYILPSSDTSYGIVFFSSHVPFDGAGTKAIMNTFLKKLTQYIVDPSLAATETVGWGPEADRLIPFITEVLADNEPREGPAYQETLKRVMDDLSYTTPRLRGFKPRKLGPGTSRRLGHKFTVDETKALLKAARDEQLTLNHVAHAAMFLMIADDNPPDADTPKDAVIMNYGLVNARNRLQAPYNQKDAYPGYCLGASAIWVDVSMITENAHKSKKEQLLTIAKHLKKQYQAQKEYPSLLSIEPEQMDLMVGALASGPPPATWIGPWYSGDGRGEDLLDPEHFSGATKVITITDFFQSLNKTQPGPFFRAYSWRGRLELSVDFNEYAMPQDVVYGFNETWAELIKLLI
ncbi:hypothetical protein NM688_g1794 [Phlebia brevispora]|uniref:Uncharacterized protein n=1 Tax=Phlebia brevispora TaxID=194682 RepID=A0ACC1TAT2_9APHY|nr:hypothetical protein NM688_g1794 [Phlebia brevispora]